MITLSSTLTAAQKAVGVTGVSYDAIWKIVLSLSGQTTKGYDRTRVIQIRYNLEENSEVAEVLLQNSDLALNDINFEQYQAIYSRGYATGVTRSAWEAGTAYSADDIVVPTTANGYQYRCVTAGTSHATTEPTWGTALGVQQTDGTVTWEMDGNAGDEYVPRPPLRVESQEYLSSENTLSCRLYLTGIPNDLKGDEAESAYPQQSTDQNTVKDLITAIGGATLTPYTNYAAYTVTYDSEDSLIDSFKPADFFSVNVNDDRNSKINELLRYTGCKRRTESDGEIHILAPTTSGTTYDYEYRLAVSTYHAFFNKALRNRFVNPNKEVVASHPDQGSYSGSATSATSYALRPKTHTTYIRASSDAQCAAMAAAIIEQYELDAERGSVTVPMNCGQELWDYILVTDGRGEDSRAGNVQYIQEHCKAASETGNGQFDMTIRLGKVNQQAIGGYGDFFTSGGIGVPEWVYQTIQEILNDIVTIYENQNIDAGNLQALWDYLIPGDDVHFNKLTVHEIMKIPGWDV